MAADLCLVDPETVTDRATYAAPRTLAVGVDDVIVNGVPVLRAGELTGRSPARPQAACDRRYRGGRMSTVDWTTKGLWLPTGAEVVGRGLFDGPLTGR